MNSHRLCRRQPRGHLPRCRPLPQLASMSPIWARYFFWLEPCRRAMLTLILKRSQVKAKCTVFHLSIDSLAAPEAIPSLHWTVHLALQHVPLRPYVRDSRCDKLVLALQHRHAFLMPPDVPQYSCGSTRPSEPGALTLIFQMQLPSLLSSLDLRGLIGSPTLTRVCSCSIILICHLIWIIEANEFLPYFSANKSPENGLVYGI